jgi:large subunit ribosomal protein L6
MKKNIKKIIKIPEDIQVELKLREITIKKDSTMIIRKFKIKNLKIFIEDKQLIIEKQNANKREKKLINSLTSHIESIINGLKTQYEYKLQICSVHFPMTVKNEKNTITIKNFLGERKDRTVNISPEVSMKIDNDIITLSSANKELAGQEAAKIESLTKVRSKDRRIFQDGIWIIKKSKGRHIKE